MNKTTKKIAAGASLAALSAAVAAASSYVTTRFLVKIALDRRPPKVVQMASTRISGGKGISDVFLQQIEGADRLLRQVEMETVTITAADGTELTGHWRPHPQAKRVIIAMHGWRSTWSRDFGMIAPFWEENGCSVLFAEQRGQNNSGGEYMGFGLTERYDVLDWIAWVTQRCGSELPIYLGGVSMGPPPSSWRRGWSSPAMSTGSWPTAASPRRRPSGGMWPRTISICPWATGSRWPTASVKSVSSWTA